MPDPSELEALALAAESFGRLAEAINTVTEKMADAIARNATDIRELRDENRVLSNRIGGLTGAYTQHLEKHHGVVIPDYAP